MTIVEKIKAIQGALGVEQDGDFGALSRAALESLVKRSREVIAPDFSPLPTSTVHPFIVEAAKWVGIRETSRNHFPGMEKLWADTSYQDGWENREPYCAALVAHVIASVKRSTSPIIPFLPTSASVSEQRAWARKRNLVVKDPTPGDVFSLLPSGTSHTGFVERVQGGVIHTIEGNTGAAGERDGDGFWRKVRRISDCDFFRVPLA